MLLLVLLDSLPPDMTSSPSLEVYCTYVSTDTIFWPLRATEWGGGAVSSQNVGSNGNACGLQKRPPYMYGVHWTSLLKQEVESNTLWGVFQGRRKPPHTSFCNKQQAQMSICIINKRLYMYICLLACLCVRVWAREKRGLWPCAKRTRVACRRGFGVVQVAWCIFFQAGRRPWGTMTTTTTKTKLTALKAMRIQKLGWIREEGRLPPNKVVVMHFSVYFLCTIYPTMNEGRPA